MQVLTLPNMLAAITTPACVAPRRSIVTASSRVMITIATHASRRPSETSESSAAMIRSLSASGSISLPKVVIEPRARARRPSTKSVSEASANTTAASTSPAGVFPSSATTTTGTSMIRSTVRTLGRFRGNTLQHVHIIVAYR